MSEAKDSCVEPALGPIAPEAEAATSPNQADIPKREVKMTAKIGKTAPDFEAGAFIEGGFRNIRLSEFKGKWVVLCFYPGDFTFV
jgi:hypothetical protein